MAANFIMDVGLGCCVLKTTATIRSSSLRAAPDLNQEGGDGWGESIIQPPPYFSVKLPMPAGTFPDEIVA